MTARSPLILFVFLALAVGCAHVPPANVTRDRFDYGEALGESWKRQTLMNVVRIRYADAPTFLDVSSVRSIPAALPLHIRSFRVLLLHPLRRPLQSPDGLASLF